ncbi:MAG: FHA domain-containing protein [Burkholderiales bacterium]|nr:FHA domain-containing protein [Burkholderiales bacterium]
MAKLVVSREGHLLESRFIGEARIVIGRAESADLRLDDATVSKQHAAIEVVGNDHILRDLGSANGTFVNGARAERHLLKHGDVIAIRDFEIRYVDHKSVAPGAGDRTMVFQSTEALSEAFAQEALDAPAPAARATAVTLAGGSLRIALGPREGKKVPLERTVTGLGERGRARAALLRRPTGIYIARVEGAAPKLNGAPVAEGWNALSDGDIVEVAGEQYVVRIG